MTSAINFSQRLFRPLGFRATRIVAGHRFVFDPATDIGMQLLFMGSFEERQSCGARNSSARTAW
jgi:hypothetical protein